MARSKLGHVDVLVGLGMVVSAGVLVVSTVLNFRFAYRMADTEFDGWLYGSGVGCAEVIKALCPFVVAAAWRNRDSTAVAGGILFFVVAASFSLSSAIGYAAHHRAVKLASSTLAGEGQRDIRRDVERLEEQLGRLGERRSPTEIARAMEAILSRPASHGRTVGQVSADCTLNRTETRSSCHEFALLAEERARADEGQRLETEIVRLRAERARTPAMEGADAQVDVLVRLARLAVTGISRSDIEAALAVVFAVILELGSGIGLYVVTAPWRSLDRDVERAMGVEGQRLGFVDEFMNACVDYEVRGELTVGELLEGYMGWCRARELTPFSRDLFVRQFAELAKQCGMPFKGRGEHGIYQQVKLVPLKRPRRRTASATAPAARPQAGS